MNPLSRAARALLVPGPAAQLGALRILVPLLILWCPETRRAPALAAVSPTLRVVPEGLGWFVAAVPITPALASLAQTLCVLGALFAVAGLYARPALAVVCASAFYLFALNQLSGAVWHDMHLLWLAALLAASPCDEALSLARRGEPAPPDSARYGGPLLWARLLLACVYFFPGVHKLVTSGLGWALSDNLRNQLWWKWAQHGAVPSWRPDRVPGLLPAGGLFVLGFELLFPALVLWRRARPWLALAGLAFHAAAGALFRIYFASLWGLYVVLLDWSQVRRVAARLRRRAVPPARVGPERATATSTVVGLALVLCAAVQGARGQQRAFPFACYPTFQWRAAEEMPDLLVELEQPDGARSELVHSRDAHGYRTQRQWGELWSLAGVTAPVSDSRLAAWLRQTPVMRTQRGLMDTALWARFYLAYLPVDPALRGRPARRGRLLSTLALR